MSKLQQQQQKKLCSTINNVYPRNVLPLSIKPWIKEGFTVDNIPHLMLLALNIHWCWLGSETYSRLFLVLGHRVKLNLLDVRCFYFWKSVLTTKCWSDSFELYVRLFLSAVWIKIILICVFFYPCSSLSPLNFKMFFALDAGFKLHLLLSCTLIAQVISLRWAIFKA